MLRKSTVWLGCGLFTAGLAIPFVLFVVFSLVANYTPIDDPLFQNQPLENWLVQVESDISAERLEAAKTQGFHSQLDWAIRRLNGLQ